MNFPYLAEPRWNSYHLSRGDEVALFFQRHFAAGERNVLILTAQSFDPRIMLVPEVICNAGGTGRRDALVLTYKNGATATAEHDELVAAAQSNLTSLATLVEKGGTLRAREVQLYSADGRRIASQRASDAISDLSDLSPYTDIALDVSGMPRSIFFPLIARVLFLLDKERAQSGPMRNLFILVAEDPDLDASITPTGMEEFADFIHSFHGSFDKESDAKLPALWIPVLGEGRLAHLQRIYDLVKPDDICPILPSPSKNPRRADHLVLEYREFFFGEHGLDPRSLEHASETNPFDVYRRLRSAVQHYENTFETLNGCRIAFSALSSKLMSLGVILAAYEAKQSNSRVGIAHVDSHGYRMGAVVRNSELYSLWITGECYG